MIVDDTFDEDLGGGNDAEDDEVGLYHCTVCNTSFTTCRVFMAHVESHTADDWTDPPLAPANNCVTMEEDDEPIDQGFDEHDGRTHDSSVDDLVSNNNYVDDTPASCTECRRVFVNERALIIHMNKAHGNKFATKLIPIAPAKDRAGTRITLSTIGDLGAIACDECGRSFPTAKQTKVHKFKSHIEPRKKRELLFRQQQRLAEQNGTDPQALLDAENGFNKMLNAPTEFYCFICDQSFSSRRSLVRHKGNIHGDRPSAANTGPVSCQHCHRSFANDRALRVHVVQIHPAAYQDPSTVTVIKSIPESKPVVQPSPVLPLSNSTSTNFYIKMRRPVGSGHLRCNGCGRHFTRMNNLYRHRKLYCTPFQAKPEHSASHNQQAFGPSVNKKGNGDTGLQKDTTSSPVKSSPGMGKTVSSDDQQQVFACSQCPKTFGMAAVLRLHMRGHRRDKPFSCDRCKLTFTRNYNLKLHNLHRCKLRDRNFGDTSLTNGTDSSKPKRYHCSRCGAGFNLASNLYTHNRSFCRMGGESSTTKDNSTTSGDINGLPILKIHESTEQSGYFTCPCCETDLPNQHELAVHALRTHSLSNVRFQFIIQTEDGVTAPLEWSAEDEALALREAAIPLATAVDSPGKHQCTICFKEFQTRRNLRRHRVRLHGERSQSRVLMAQAQATPVLTSTPEKRKFALTSVLKPIAPMPTLVPLQTFASLPALDDSGEIACDSCTKLFNSPRALAVHKVRKHDAAPICNIKRVRCEFCRKRFRNPLTLARHRQAHIDERDGVKPSESEMNVPSTGINSMAISNNTEPDIVITYDKFIQEQPSDAVTEVKSGDPASPVGHQQLDTSLRSEDGQYMCRVCERLFVNRLSLTGHLKSHYKESTKPYSCGSCVRRFTSLNNLRYHRSKFCPVLQQQNIEERVASNTVPQHLEMWLGGGSGLHCLHCQATFADKDALEVHALAKHSNPETGLIDCFKCKRDFATYVAFRIHMTRAHNASESLFVTATNVSPGSNKVDKPMVKLETQLSPTIVHSDKLKMKIKVPPPILPRPTHILPKLSPFLVQKVPPVVTVAPVSKPGLPFICRRCSRSFNTVYGLGAHMRFCRDINQAQIECSNCHRPFKTTYALDIHTKTCKAHAKSSNDNMNTKSAPPKCSSTMVFDGKPGCKVCGRMFVSSQALGAHSRFCRLANKGVRSKSLSNTTSNSPPSSLVCNICNKSFTTAQSLGSHRRVHRDYMATKEDQSELQESDDLAQSPSPADEEEAEDTEAANGDSEDDPITFEEPVLPVKVTDVKEAPVLGHKCKVCTRSFANPQNLASHMRAHATLDHPCPNCSRKFATQSKLYYHQSWFCSAASDEKTDKSISGSNFGCSVCGLMFSSVSRLERHKNLEHGDFVPPVKKKKVVVSSGDDNELEFNDD